MSSPLKVTRVVVLSTLTAVMLGGCAGAHVNEHRGMTLAHAREVVAEFEASLGPAASRIDVTADEAGALVALKSDRLDAFPPAVKAIEAMKVAEDGSGDVDIQVLALRAQLYLAWGEAELTVAEVLARTATALENNARALSTSRNLSAEQKARLAADAAAIEKARQIDEALRLLASEHVEIGGREADAVIQRAPDDYQGYRVAADAARMRNQWSQFGELLQRVESHNPDSNGLRFLRGVASWMRDGDASTAAQHFRSALLTDATFVRAQAQLVLVAPSLSEQHAELQNLKSIAPDHQLVRWAGPGIERAYQAAQDRQRQIDAAIGAPTASSPPQPE
jgi:hypothetical protein